MIEETHRDKTLKEISNKFLDDQSAYVTYGETIKVISGKKGTLFVEKQRLSQVAVCEKRRLILMIYYVLARKIPPERPRTLSRLGGDVLPTQ